MIKILLFTSLKEKLGKESLEWDGSGLTVTELKQQLMSELHLSTQLQAIMTAVNEEFVEDTYMLAEGDIVAFIPPVSGG